MAELSWLTVLGLLFLTFNSGMAIYRSNGDAVTMVLVGFCYSDLILLFIFLTRKYELGGSQGGRTNGCRTSSLRSAVWALTTLLSITLSYRVALLMPLPMAALVWAMAVVVVVGVYGAVFGEAATTRSSVPRASV
jgi:hypothetical protein